MLSFGMLCVRAAWIALRRRGLPFGSPPPRFAAMVISFDNLLKILPRLASIAPLKRLTFDHLLCPAIGVRSYLNLKLATSVHLAREMTCEGRNLPRQLIARKLISSIAAHVSWRASRASESQSTRKLPNARVDGHVYAYGLICHYCERLRRRADVSPPAVLDIQNVISWRESDPIISMFVCCDMRSFGFIFTAQDDKWIIDIVLRCHFRWCVI